MSPDPNSPDVVVRYACETLDELVAVHALHVSEGGMFLPSRTAVAIGKLVDFEVQLSGGRVVLSGAGRIAWKRDVPAGGRPAGVAVKFVELDEASRALIDRLVAATKGAVGEFDRTPAAAEPETPAPRGREATIDIEPVWPDEAETLERAVVPTDRVPAERAGPITAAGFSPAEARWMGVNASADEPVRVQLPRRRSAESDVEWPHGRVSRIGVGLWIAVLLIAAALGVYRFRNALHDAGLAPVIPDIPGLPTWLSGATLPACPALPTPTPSSVFTVPSPSASAAPTASTEVRPDVSVRPDAVKSPAPAVSAKAARSAPPAKPRRPKPSSSDDNPY
jgi:uncharacterized protein (TIGR02266 family)